MSESFKKSLFIFRRDLRIEDNTALNEALTLSKEVICCFIFDDRQSDKNPFFGSFSFKFLLDSLQDLSASLDASGGRLYFFSGKAEDVVSELIKSEKVEAIFFNRDYTPFARKRDKAIYDLGKNLGVTVKQYADALLNEPEDACKDNQSPYTVFTPYFRKNSERPVKEVKKLTYINFFKGTLQKEDKTIFKNYLNQYKNIDTVKGGRKEAIKILDNIKKQKNYIQERDFLSLDSTTHLSAHNKFGTVSIREVHAAIKKAFGLNHALIRQLYWRDFFTHIAFHFPHVFGDAFNRKYSKIEWENDKKKFKAWCEGKTGFPIVDAAMHEINTTGFMHNRARMIAASFLVKDLHIDWRWGEKYFANKLVDYDPAVNNGSWQWAASTGCDAQPYFRIFNPWLQQEKFDRECTYIKRWLPELKDIAPKVLHKLYNGKEAIKGYPSPIVIHSQASSIAIEMFGK